MPGDAAGYTSGNVIVQAPYQIVFGTGNSSSDVYIKEVAGGLSINQPLSVPAITSASHVGANNGNTVTLLNAQGNAGAITGTGAAATLYTYSLPANTVATGKAIRITLGYQHTTGSAGVSYQITVNGRNVLFTAGATDASNSVASGSGSRVVIEVQATGATTGVCTGTINKSDGSGASLAFAQTGFTWTSNQTITASFNVANTDAVTPIAFMVELVQ